MKSCTCDAAMEISLLLKVTLALVLLPQFGQRQNFSIEGSISSEDGSAIGTPLVFLEALTSRPIGQNYADVSGNFTFEYVEAGTYYIRIKQEGFEEFAQRIEVPASHRQLTVFLRRKLPDPPAVREIHLGTKFQVDVRQLSIPEKAVRQYQKARADLEERNTSKAIRRLREALSIAPNFIEAAFYLASALYEIDRFQEAEETLTRALAIVPKQPQLRLMLANVLVKEAKYEDALAEIDSYLEENPDAPDRSSAQTTRLQLIQAIE